MKFHGKVGYGNTVETSPGVHEDVVVEYEYFGDVIRKSRTLTQGENLNKDLSLGNSISIVADPYARANFFLIRYVVWEGAYWTVADVEAQPPRLILTLGEVYHGPKAAAPVTP